MTTRRNGGTSPRSRRPSRSRSSSARSPRSEQQTQPLPSTTVRSSTRRSRWWSIATSPSSFTITAVSPICGWESSRASSVVLPLPRKPVRRVTGVFSAKAADELRIERIERPPGELRSLCPEHAEVVDDRGVPLAVSQDVDAAGPVAELEAVVAEHPVHEPDAEDASAPPTVLLGPVVVEQHTTERTHLVSLSTCDWGGWNGQGDRLCVRHRCRRGGRLARLVRRRRLARRHLARHLRRRDRNAAPVEALRAQRPEDDLVHTRTLDRDVPRADEDGRRRRARDRHARLLAREPDLDDPRAGGGRPPQVHRLDRGRVRP